MSERKLKFYGEPPLRADDGSFPGRLIVFEGPDGSGRSTHIRLTKEWLEDHGYGVVDTGLTRSELAGKGIERAKTGHKLDPLTLNLFYATDFADRLERTIIPSLRGGADRTGRPLHVLLDSPGVSQGRIARVDAGRVRLRRRSGPRNLPGRQRRAACCPESLPVRADSTTGSRGKTSCGGRTSTRPTSTIRTR